MISEAAFIRATRQLWKLAGALLCPIILGLVILYQEWFGEGLSAFQNPLILLTVIAFIGFAWGCLSIICPKCHCRLLAQTVGQKSFIPWIHWFMTFTECPNCRFTPADSGKMT